MVKNSEQFPNIDMESAMKLAQSDAAKQLFALLRTANAQQLQSAMDQAASGDLTQAKETLQELLSSTQAKQLLRQLQEDGNGGV